MKRFSTKRMLSLIGYLSIVIATLAVIWILPEPKNDRPTKHEGIPIGMLEKKYVKKKTLRKNLRIPVVPLTPYKS